MAIAISTDKTVVATEGSVVVTITGLAANSNNTLSFAVGGMASSYNVYADGSGNASYTYVVPNSLTGTCTISVTPISAATTTTITVVSQGS